MGFGAFSGDMGKQFMTDAGPGLGTLMGTMALLFSTQNALDKGLATPDTVEAYMKPAWDNLLGGANSTDKTPWAETVDKLPIPDAADPASNSQILSDYLKNNPNASTYFSDKKKAAGAAADVAPSSIDNPTMQAQSSAAPKTLLGQ